jgi:hypothetical protein
MRVVFAIGTVAVVCMAISGSARALPIAPVPAEVTSDTANIVPVYYYRGGYYPYRWHGGYYHHRYHRYGRWHYY